MSGGLSKVPLERIRMVAAGRGKTMCLEPVVRAVMSLAERRGGGGKEEGAAVRRRRLVYLGTATFDGDEYFDAQTNAYRDLPSCEVIKLDVSERAGNIPSREDIESTIRSADIIMVSGGNTLYAVNRWKSLGIDRMIYDRFADADGCGSPPVLCGGSAGAICWFAHGHSDSMDPTTFLVVDPNLTEEQKKDWEYIRVEGLGYIRGLCVPHHDATQSNGLPRSRDSDGMLLRYPDEISIGIEEAAAFVVSDGKAWVVSAGDSLAGNDGDGDNSSGACCHVKKVEKNGDDARIRSEKITAEDGPCCLEALVNDGKILKT